VVDRYSNWPIVEKASGGTNGLVDCLRRTFVTFGNICGNFYMTGVSTTGCQLPCRSGS